MLTLGDWAYWLLCLGVLGANIALVYVAWWALFADRAKGRRRCPRCWYDLAYSPGMTCAECGFTGRKESQFQKTRRRYGIASAAILGSAAISLAVTERATNRGLTSMLPSRVLTWMLPLAGGPRHPVFSELISRSNLDLLSDSDRRRIAARCANGDWWNRPTSEEWISKYGDFLWSFRSTLTSEKIEQPLLSIPPRIDLETRPVWPQDIPIVVGLQVREWWPVGMECRVTARPLLPNAEPVTLIRSPGFLARTPLLLTLPPLDEGIDQVAVELNIERRRLALDANRRLRFGSDGEPEPLTDWEPVEQQTVSVPVRVKGDGGGLDEILPPVMDEEMDRMLVQVFSAGVVKWESGRSPVRFNITLPASYVPEFDDTAVGASVELLREGVLARRLHVWWLAGTSPVSQSRLSSRMYGFEVDFEDMDLLHQLEPGEAERWQIRVRSEPAVAMRVRAGSKRWQGEFTVPLRVNRRSDAAPPRPWRQP